MSVPLAELEDVRKVYGAGEYEVWALAGVSLRLEAGEFVAIVGPSGSGKSTCMNILGCLDRPSSGRYLLEGQDASAFDDRTQAEVRNRKMGFVFQSFNLLPRASALENVSLPLLYSRPRKPREAAMEALERVGLTRRAHHRPNQLSGGEQQRVAIARALVNDPPVVLADEPTGNLDTHTGEEIIALLEQLNRHGTTLIVVTHNTDISQRASRVIFFRDGKVVSDTRA